MDTNRESEIATVVYLVKMIDSVLHFYLARKKQKIHKSGGKSLAGTKKLNGYGGKLEKHHLSVRDCAINELRDESGVVAQEDNLIECACVDFFWPGNSSHKCDMKVYFFMLEKYEGTPIETSEMGTPQLYTLRNAPWDDMNLSDADLLPHVFARQHYVTEQIYFKEIGGKTVIASRFTRMKRF